MMGELERAARRIAASMMNLVKDPEGLKLPDDLWQQAIPRAEKECEERFGLCGWPSMDQIQRS